MYNTEHDGAPSKPVIGSQLSAEKAAKRWIEENNLQKIRDASGTLWRVVLKVTETPSPTDHRQMIWHLSLQCHTKLTAAELIAGKIFDATEDARVLELIADKSIPIHNKPLQWSEHSLEEARLSTLDKALQIKQQWAKETLREVKRQLVFRFIDQMAHFGASQA